MIESIINQFTNGDLWGFLAAIPFIVAGFVGLVLPILPCTVLIFTGFVVYGSIAGFEDLSLTFFLIQGGLVFVSYLVDFIATAFGVKFYGGSKAAVWGAIIGSFAIFFIGPFGLIIGPLAGAAAGEIWMGKEIPKALHAGLGSFIGFLGGILVKGGLSIIMVTFFIFRIL